MFAVRCSAFGIADDEESRVKKEADLLELLDRADDRVEIWPVAGLKFRMEQMAIAAYFKGAAT